MENTNNKKSSLILLAGIIAVIVIIAIAAVIFFLSNKSYRTIKVVEVEGNVTVSNEKENSQVAYVDMLLKNKDKVETAENGRLALLLDEQKSIEVYPLSVVHVVATGNSNKNNTKTTLVLEKGSILNEVNTHLGEEENYEVQTPSVCMAVRGTKFKVESRKNDVGTNETYIEVTDGTVEAYRDGEADTVKIDAGYNVIIGEGDKLSEVTLAENLPYVEFGFDINDLYVFGVPGKEMTEEDFKNGLQSVIEKYNLSEKIQEDNDYIRYRNEDSFEVNFRYSNSSNTYNIWHGAGIISFYKLEADENDKQYQYVSGCFDSFNLDDQIYDDGFISFGPVHAELKKEEMKKLLQCEILDSYLSVRPEGHLEGNINCNWFDGNVYVTKTLEENGECYYFCNQDKEYGVNISFDEFYGTWRIWRYK